jgi:ribosome-associated protein
MTEEVAIQTDYIKLDQFLKLSGAIDTGGQAKMILAENAVKVNGELEQRRGRKLYANDLVSVNEVGEFRVVRK